MWEWNEVIFERRFDDMEIHRSTRDKDAQLPPAELDDRPPHFGTMLTVSIFVLVSSFAVPAYTIFASNS